MKSPKDCRDSDDCAHTKSCDMQSWKCRQMLSGGLFSMRGENSTHIGFVIVVHNYDLRDLSDHLDYIVD